VSEQVEVQTAPATFSDIRPVSGFAATAVSAVAMDTARQLVVTDQEGGVFAYYTANRGKSFSALPLDPSGRRPRVAWEPQSGTAFVCYNAFGGIRIRVSQNGGRSFREGALDIAEPFPDDGGVQSLIQHCDIAPWHEGLALVTAVHDDQIKVWTVKNDLTLQGPPVVAFSASTTQFAPEYPRIATLPSDFVVHVLFTVTRRTSGGITDNEVLGVYRDATTSGAFVGPLNVSAPPDRPSGVPGDQFGPTVVVDPSTKRAVAAWVSAESSSMPTVYVSYWNRNPGTGQWGWVTGSDLNVFVQNTVSRAYMVVAERQVTDGDWVARSPSLAVGKDGRIFLGFAAGVFNGGNPVLQPWVVQFDFEQDNRIIQQGVKGWYVTPGLKASPERIANVGKNDYVGPNLAADAQISWYLTFIEGVGLHGEVPNRPVTISRPR
jgi:hypothetical protein